LAYEPASDASSKIISKPAVLKGTNVPNVRYGEKAITDISRYPLIYSQCIARASSQRGCCCGSCSGYSIISYNTKQNLRIMQTHTSHTQGSWCGLSGCIISNSKMRLATSSLQKTWLHKPQLSVDPWAELKLLKIHECVSLPMLVATTPNLVLEIAVDCRLNALKILWSLPNTSFNARSKVPLS
jgi:hypothetical protein